MTVVRAASGGGAAVDFTLDGPAAAFTLRSFVDAGIALWPGLLLPALAETVEPAWTVGNDFLVAFAIAGNPGAVIYVGVNDGAAISVSAAIDRDQRQPTVIYATERAFLMMAAGLDVAADQDVRCDGSAEQVRRLFSWFARGQGLTGPR